MASFFVARGRSFKDYSFCNVFFCRWDILGSCPSAKILLGYLLFFSSFLLVFILLEWNTVPDMRIVSRDRDETKRANNFATIFTSFDLNSKKKFKTFAHRMAIKNWSNQMPEIQPVLFHYGKQHPLIDLAADANWDRLPLKSFNKHGTPKLKPMFAEIVEKYNSTFYGFVNGDILFSGTLMRTLKTIEKTLSKFDDNVLVVGIRKNLNANLTLPEERYVNDVDALGKIARLFTVKAIDYFFFTAGHVLNWTTFADVVIGRPAYDNYIISEAIKAGVHVIDATSTLLALHLSTPHVTFDGASNIDTLYNKIVIGPYNYVRGYTSAVRLATTFDAFGDVVIISR